MGNKWSRPPKAERIQVSRGNYECEISFTGEAGLRECKRKCQKNPGHVNFIPQNAFNIEHLPYHYRDSLLVDYVRATSDLTCRISVSGISRERPTNVPLKDQSYPFSAFKGKRCNINGTGFASHVMTFTEKDTPSCQCGECRSGTHTPKKTWGYVEITTATHVVFNQEEARHTKCAFFYDSHETDIKKVPTIKGLKCVWSHIKDDWCVMKYITHENFELLDRLKILWERWRELRIKVINKYFPNTPPPSPPGVPVQNLSVGCDTNIRHDLCIVVSHPHGCTKAISCGTWTDRRVVSRVDDSRVCEEITYNYNTPTCPGSSGAPVFTLSKDHWTGWFYSLPPHSEGRQGNDNNSGTSREVVYS